MENTELTGATVTSYEPKSTGGFDVTAIDNAKVTMDLPSHDNTSKIETETNNQEEKPVMSENVSKESDKVLTVLQKSLLEGAKVQAKRSGGKANDILKKKLGFLQSRHDSFKAEALRKLSADEKMDPRRVESCNASSRVYSDEIEAIEGLLC